MLHKCTNTQNSSCWSVQFQTAVDVLGLAPRPFPVFLRPRLLQLLLVPLTPPPPPLDAPFPGLGVDILELLGLNPSDILGEEAASGVVTLAMSPVVKSGSSKLCTSDH